MRIVCPNCAATYDVPVERTTGRPVVRCVRCDQEWQLGEAPEEMREAGPGAAPTGREDRPTDLGETLAPVPPELIGGQAEPEIAPAVAESAITGPADRAATDASAIALEDANGAPDETGAAPGDSPRGSTGGNTEPIPTPAAGVAIQTAPLGDASPEAAAPVAEVASAGPIEAPAQPRQPSRLRAALAANLVALVGWAFSLGLLMGLGWLAVQHRAGIMLAWPPSQRLFGWLGLT